jgi:FixJ family two-component response regulator/HD-like signal output (HDOD) protein
MLSPMKRATSDRPTTDDSRDGSERRDTILVVDDDDDARNTVERSLRRLGYAVLGAADGNEGLRVALEASPAVILTDIRMPGMDGHELLRRLGERGVEAAVIVMSGFGEMDDVVNVLRAGAVDYLKKPWSASGLLSSVARAVQIHRDRRRSDRAGEPAEGHDALELLARHEGSDGESSHWNFAAILARLKHGDILIPPVSGTVAELRALVRRPNARTDDVVALIERDQRLTTELLRLSNRMPSRRGPRSNDLRTAVIRTGMRQIQSLVETIDAQGWFRVEDSTTREIHAQILRFSLARAVAMRALADLAMADERLDSETAYVAGLLSDTGASFLLWLAAERAAAGGANPPGIDTLLRFIRQHHQEIGAVVLNHWEVDPRVVFLARTHHADAPPAPPSPYWSLQVLAEAFAERVAGPDPTSTSRHNAELLDRCGAEMRIGSTVIKKVLEHLGAEFQAILETLS